MLNRIRICLASEVARKLVSSQIQGGPKHLSSTAVFVQYNVPVVHGTASSLQRKQIPLQVPGSRSKAPLPSALSAGMQETPDMDMQEVLDTSVVNNLSHTVACHRQRCFR